MTSVRSEFRTMLAWCPDWPVVAAEKAGLTTAGVAVAVMHANRVVACSAEARRAGVRRGMRKRDAQRLSPQMTMVDHDAGRDAMMFEPVVAAVEEIGAGVAVIRPGVCALAARGPARYFGGETVAGERIVEQVAVDCDVEVQIGIADGTFAALLAARAGRHVPPGGTPEFLRQIGIAALDRPPLVDLLKRLGISTLGAFAALPASDVLARFGLDAWLAHRLASGLDDRPLQVRQPPPDLVVEQPFDEPLERVDMAAFAARAMAEQLHERLAGHGLVATRLSIEARTAAGQELYRVWRHDGVLTAQAIADRTRWQLDGWLTRRKIQSGLVMLRLVPDGILHQAGLQPGLWGEAGAATDKAHRAMHRAQGLLGPEAVLVAVESGGRHPGERVTQVPWGDERTPALPAGPWPGGLLDPLPTWFEPEPLAAEVTTMDGTAVSVNARLHMPHHPHLLHMGRGRPVKVVDWHGPWAAAERWWDDGNGRRAVWIQLVLEDGRAALAELSAGSWTIPGWYR